MGANTHFMIAKETCYIPCASDSSSQILALSALISDWGSLFDINPLGMVWSGYVKIIGVGVELRSQVQNFESKSHVCWDNIRLQY